MRNDEMISGATYRDGLLEVRIGGIDEFQFGLRCVVGRVIKGACGLQGRDLFYPADATCRLERVL